MTSVFDAMAEQIQRTALPQRPGRRRWSRATGAVAAGAGAVAAIAAVLVVMLGSSATTPAYAVTRRADGAVTISLWRISGVAALNRKLTAMDISVKAVPIERRCRAFVHLIGYDREPQSHATMLTITMNPHSGRIVSMTVVPPTLPGRTMIIGVRHDGGVFSAQDVADPAPACIRGSV